MMCNLGDRTGHSSERVLTQSPSTVAKSDCDEQHFADATEIHINRELCGHWLEIIEQGKFTPHRKEQIRESVIRDYLRLGCRLDTGELQRLQKALSLASDPSPKPTPWELNFKLPVMGIEIGIRKGDG